MQEIPFSYRIKKLIQRANPMDFIELVDGRYYWIYEGELKQLADLMMLSKLENGDPRLTAIMDKGITCLRQIDDYLTWLGCVHIPVENEHLFRLKMNADSGLLVHRFRTPQCTYSDAR